MIKIFQIDTNKDKNKVKFLPYNWLKKFDFSIYEEVWSGEEPDGCNDLNGIYEVFNLHHPNDFKGHSLSVSDIVQIIDSDKEKNGYYYCDSFGWVQIDIK